MSINRIFFISSNEKNTPNEFYTETPGFTDFKIEYSEKKQDGRRSFSISINSFKIIKKNLIRNKEIDEYELTVKLKLSGYLSYYIYSRSLSFVEIKNHFIYGFKLDDLKTIIFDGKAPQSYALSKKEQLSLYMKFLKKIKSDPGDILSNDFCEDTIDFIIKDKKFDLDIYLELLEYFKNTKNIFKILDNFEIKNCEIPIDFNGENYESLLEKIKSNQEMYTKYCFEDGDDNKIKKKFYTLLLYFRLANNKEKVKPKTSIDEKSLWQLFAEIINKNEKLYPVVEIPEEGLIKEIMNQKKISYDLVKKIIVSFNSVEELLSFMDQNYDIIFKNCQEECSNMIERLNSITNSSNENEMTVREEIFKYLEKEENEHNIYHKKYQIILFNQKTDFYFKYEKVILLMINKSIYICLRNDKKFDDFKEKEKEVISNLKNKQFLKYLSNDISEYEKNNYGIYIYPETKTKIELYTFLNIFDGIELKTFEKEDLNQWNKIKDKVYKLKDMRYNLEDFNIIEKIKNLDEFNKFVNLIYNGDDYNFESIYEKKLISALDNKFILLISEKISHEYFRILSILINKSYQLNLQPENFICNIEKKLDESEIYKIYEYLVNYNQLFSDNLINHLADYIIQKNNIPIIKNLTNIKEKIIPIIFTKIDNFINDTMVYDNSPINTHFKLLNDMGEEGYSEYAKNNISNVSEVLKNLESGMMSYDSINSIYNNNNQKELFEKKISILLFGNESKIAALIKSVKDYLNDNKKNLKIFGELKEIINNYYSWKKDLEINIKLIDKTVNTIKKGFKDKNIKAQINENIAKLNKIYDENGFHKKYIIKDSLVFNYEKKIWGKKKLEIDKVFKIVSNKFNELEVLFDKNWQSKIKNETIFNYYNTIKKAIEINKNISFEEQLKKDLEILSNYHSLKIEDSEINKLRDDIIIHINCIDIQSILNKKISYYDSRNTPSNNEFKAKLQNIIEYLKPKDSNSEKENTKNPLLLQKLNE